MIRGLTDNIWWKLLSLVIAFLLWARYSAQTELATSIPASIQYRNLPPNLEVTETTPLERVYMKVRGPAGTLTASDLNTAAILIDLKGVDRPGKRTFPLSDKNFHLPNGVSLVSVVPSQVNLEFETRVTKEVPVEPRFRSSAPPGYQVVSQVTIPERVRISGPQSRINAIQSLPTDAIDLSSTYGDAEFRVSPSINDRYVRLDQPNPVVVRVKLEKLPPPSR
jgi:YbbR domain-containing protein